MRGPWLFAVAALALPGSAPQQAGPYEVYAVRYATIPNFPVRALISGADRSRRMDLAMSVWLMQGNGHTILLDAGFYRQKFLDQFHPVGFMKPSEALAPLGLKPEDVTDVVVSHIHWDHIDGLDLFPKAHIWIQQAEYEYYVGPMGEPLHPAIDTADAKVLYDLRAAGRVTLIPGDDQEILPGIRVYTGGKHTYASEYVGVHTQSGTTVLASHNCYLYENLDTHRPIAQTLDSVSNLAAQDRMRRLASSPTLIVPGHDPAVYERFPNPGHGIARID